MHYPQYECFAQNIQHPRTPHSYINLKAIMQANSAFLNKLKNDAIEKNRNYSNKAWLLCATSVFFMAVCYNSSLLIRLPLLGLFVAFLLILYNLDNQTWSCSKPSHIVSRNGPFMTTSDNQPSSKIKNATERQTFLNAAVATDQTQHKKEIDLNMQNAMRSENFDPQSPQRITQAVCSDVPEQQPGSYVGLTSSLYPNAQSPFIGKSNMASLGYHITGSSSNFWSPTGNRSTVTAHSSNVNTFSRSGFQTEPSAPVWHAYHTSPPHVDMGYGSPSSHGRKGRSTLSGSYSSAEEDGDDPINEIVNRVTSEQRSSDSLLHSPSFTQTSGFTSPRQLMRTGSGGVTPAGGSRTTGMTEDRLQHVLAKYIESQEQIVSESSAEILRQLTLRASTPNSYSKSLLQSQEDVSRIQALLQLQSQRQVLQSGRVLTLPDLLSHCRGVAISEDLIRKYEAAAEVLLSPNRNSGGGQGAISSPRNSAATPPAFQRSNSGSFTVGFGTSISAASFGKGWMSPAPAVEPFVSSSGVVGGNIFTSSRRSRRF